MTISDSYGLMTSSNLRSDYTSGDGRSSSPFTPRQARARCNSVKSISSSVSKKSEVDRLGLCSTACIILEIFFLISWKIFPIIGLFTAAELVYNKIKGNSGKFWGLWFSLSMLGGLGILMLLAIVILSIWVVSELLCSLGRRAANIIHYCSARQCKTIN